MSTTREKLQALRRGWPWFIVSSVGQGLAFWIGDTIVNPPPATLGGELLLDTVCCFSGGAFLLIAFYGYKYFVRWRQSR